MMKDGLNKETCKLEEIIQLSDIIKVTFEKSNFTIGLKTQFQFDIEFEQNRIVIPSFGILNSNTQTPGVHFVIMITTILATRNAKSLTLGIMIVSSAMPRASLVQVQTHFSAFLVTIQTINSMIEEQCAPRHAGMVNC